LGDAAGQGAFAPARCKFPKVFAKSATLVQRQREIVELRDCILSPTPFMLSVQQDRAMRPKVLLKKFSLFQTVSSSVLSSLAWQLGHKAAKPNCPRRAFAAPGR
jgi:hypothetical protein